MTENGPNSSNFNFWILNWSDGNVNNNNVNNNNQVRPFCEFLFVTCKRSYCKRQ